jgi:hypothetical protein
MRLAILTIAAGLALLAAVPATASARSARPSEAQATHVAQRLADSAADGVRSFGIFEIEQVSVSCDQPLDRGAHSLKCMYALHVRNTEDGTGVTCVNSVYVYKTRGSGRLYGRFGSQICLSRA